MMSGAQPAGPVPPVIPRPPTLTEAAQFAAKPAASSVDFLATLWREHRAVAALLLVLLLLALAALIVALVLIRQRMGKSSGDGAVTRSPQFQIERRRLLRVWRSFRSQLPASVQKALPASQVFVVLGAAGAGKTTSITRLIDWQGQASEFLPSATADPLIQIYLGRQVVVQEISAALLQSSTREANQALQTLWRELVGGRPPIVVVTLSMAALREAPPDRLRQQAALLRGKINLLAEVIAAPVVTRLCVTGMDQVPGYSALARFLHSTDVELSVDLGSWGQHDLADALKSCAGHLPRALVTQPAGVFESIIALLHSGPELLAPLAQFAAELHEAPITGVRPELSRLYFFSPPQSEQVGDPFAATKAESRLPPRPGGLWAARRLGALWASAGHTAAAALLLTGVVIASLVLISRHGAQVRGAKAAAQELTSTIARARNTSGRPQESEAVRKAAQQAMQHLEELTAAEAHFAPRRLLYRSEKAELRLGLAAALRSGYLLPMLEVAVRKRSREMILLALVAIYATKSNSLGQILRTQADEFQRNLGLPDSVALQYLDVQDAPLREVVLTTLPPLEDGATVAQQRALVSSEPWTDFLRQVSAAVQRPFLPVSELIGLRKRTQELREVLLRVRHDARLAQLYQALAEESPLDLQHLLGKHAGSLRPGPHLVDNIDALESLLALMDESSASYLNSDRLSLLNLLKWVNELGQRRLNLQDTYAIAMEGQSFVIAKQDFLDLLFRSRKRLLVGASAPCKGKGCREGTKKPACGGKRSPCTKQRVHAAAPESGEPRPKFGEILSGSALPASGISDYYNRQVFTKEIRPLVQELSKALSQSSVLSADEKLTLSRIVRGELRDYARRYCAALTQFHLRYELPSASTPALHAALVGLLLPGSAFIQHLRTVVDNASLDGLSDPYLSPLAECLAPFAPLAQLIAPDKEGGYPALLPYKTALAQATAELGSPGPASPAQGASKPEPQPESKGEPKPGASGKPEPASAPLVESPLIAWLTPVGRTALRLRLGTATSPRASVEGFLDGAGVAGVLRRPFLRPLLALARRGDAELEAAMARYFAEQLSPKLERLLAGFPFSRNAATEVTVEELEILNPARGAFWTAARSAYAGLLQEMDGEWSQPPAAEEEPQLRLPKELLPSLRRAAHLSRLFFASDGAQQPLRFSVRPLPLPAPVGPQAPQPTLSILSVGKTQVVGFNQQPAGKPFAVNWWEPGVAAVGLEYTQPESNRKQTQSIEIADSRWGLYRLLARAGISDDRTIFWQLPRESDTSRWSLGFAFEPEPWSIFRPPAGAGRGGRP